MYMSVYVSNSKSLCKMEKFTMKCVDNMMRAPMERAANFLIC